MNRQRNKDILRGLGLSESERQIPKKKSKLGKVASAFLDKNNEGETRVFVAGGSRSGKRKIYEEEAFKLGQIIGKQNYRLDFGLSSKGIMGAVAKGVLDSWSKTDHPKNQTPIHAVTTKEYFALYQNDKLLSEVSDIIVAHTLEERKQQLLDADFVIFTPGGVGTLDELAYDCVAMQDGFLKFKPFVLYNIDGFFHHLLEYLKEMNIKGFSDPMPFIVVDNSIEAGIAFEMIGQMYKGAQKSDNAREIVNQIIHDLPYVITQVLYSPQATAKQVLEERERILSGQDIVAKETLIEAIERAYLDKEIDRMYNRLAKSGRDTAQVSYKLTSLKRRSTGGK